jgi:hypothetical protein
VGLAVIGPLAIGLGASATLWALGPRGTEPPVAQVEQTEKQSSDKSEADKPKSDDKKPTDDKKSADKKPTDKKPDPHWVKPKGWPKDMPLPQVNSNCSRCHLTAGRQLTWAVQDFVRSAHDIQEMTCHDCHGGNSENDTKAHEEEDGFISISRAAHVKSCSTCHDDAAAALTKGPHAWDWSKKVNLDYPLCWDCHGNHDVGNPPDDYQAVGICSDCHDDFEKEFPHHAAVLNQNDKLWATILKVRAKHPEAAGTVPADFQDKVAELRHTTMQIMHSLGKLTAEEARQLNARVEKLRIDLEKSVQSDP